MAAAAQRHKQRIGLLAGGGQFPVEFARAAVREGYEVICLGIAGMAPSGLDTICHTFRTVPLARIGLAIRHFKRRGVDRAVMAGKIEKRILFDPFRILRLMPDLRTLHMWYHFARENRKDDTILLAVIREFARDGITFDSALDYAPELLVNHGFLTRRRPTTAQWEDIRFGWEIAKEMGRLDVGQSIIVNDKAVIAVEAVEGTDDCIRRAGTLCRRGGFTVVKVSKPQQDMRFDVPTVGLGTLRTMHEAGGRVLAIESEKTIVLDRDEFSVLADKFGIAVVALNAQELSLRAVA
ncbi:MAG: UDP-2,3-diacylglucosamine diphosphatase LpxI [Planctomycetaceae bacterium]